MFFQQLVNGLAVGGIYALIAIGYTMVYGILFFVNFAHGDIYMLGTYCAFFIFGFIGVEATGGVISVRQFFAALLPSMLACAAIGVVLEKFAYRPIRNGSRLSAMISALGASLFLCNGAMYLFGSQTKPMPKLFAGEYFTIGGTIISYIQTAVLLVSFVLMVALHLFIRHTKLGKAIRAVSDDQRAAVLMGIDMDRVISATFAIGSALAGAAGIMVGIYYGAVYPSMGAVAGIKAFTAAILGGIGNIPGAMLGGVLLGVIESLGGAYISFGYRDAVAFFVLIITLCLMPTGILKKGRT
ncbi:MAG: branched-chain amino acid ABC transporter permease [Synergistaceae bacterium]|jgi:branched-chain amino acid transport system permease protein|nr:branched-chain amino acid ABC transporter permease [Synergistaceae bacterium]